MSMIANTNTNTSTKNSIPTNKDIHIYVKLNVNSSINELNTKTNYLY